MALLSACIFFMCMEMSQEYYSSQIALHEELAVPPGDTLKQKGNDMRWSNKDQSVPDGGRDASGKSQHSPESCVFLFSAFVSAEHALLVKM